MVQPFGALSGASNLSCDAPSKLNSILKSYCEIKFKIFKCDEYLLNYPEFKDDIVDCKSNDALQSDVTSTNFSFDQCGIMFKKSWTDFLEEFANFFKLPGQPDVVTFNSLMKTQPRLSRGAEKPLQVPGPEKGPSYDLKWSDLKEALFQEVEKQGIRLVCLSPRKQLEISCYGLAAAINPAKPLQALKAVRGVEAVAATAKKGAKIAAAGKKAAAEVLESASALNKLKMTSPLKAKTQVAAAETMAKNEKLMEDSLRSLSMDDLKAEVKISMEVAKRETGYPPGLSPTWQPNDVDNLINNFHMNHEGSFLKNMTGNLSSYSGFRELLEMADESAKIDDKAKRWIQLWEDKTWSSKVFSELERRLKTNSYLGQ